MSNSTVVKTKTALISWLPIPKMKRLKSKDLRQFSFWILITSFWFPTNVTYHSEIITNPYLKSLINGCKIDRIEINEPSKRCTRQFDTDGIELYIGINNNNACVNCHMFHEGMIRI